MSSSTIYTAYRALLTGLSLVDDPDGTPLANEALTRFTDEAQIDFEDGRKGPHCGGLRRNIDQEMTVMRGIDVSSDRDTANKAYIAAVDQIIQTFESPSNYPSGVRKCYYMRHRREEKTADIWLVFVEFEIEYQISISA